MSSIKIDDVTTELALRRCCYICCKQFMTMEFMWDHVSNKHSYYKSPTKFTCTHCGDLQDSVEDIVAHELKTHGFGFACRFCGITCENEDDRIDHILNKHLKPKVKLCRDCKKEIKLDELHICEKTNNSGQSNSFDCLKCHYCENYFIHSDSLYNHVIKDHWQLFTSLCKSCGQLFHSMIALRQHRSDSSNCLDGCQLDTGVNVDLKFLLPSHADKTNSYIEEMDEIMKSEPENLKTKIPSPEKRNLKQIVSENSEHAEMISKSLKKKKEKVEEAETSTMENVEVENHIVGTSETGEKTTTVSTDVFESDILRKKQQDLLTKSCYICCKMFYNPDTMWDHVTKTHSYYIKPDKYSCTHCGITFTTLGKLVSHEFEDHGIGNACCFCGKKHKTESKKIEHVFAKHLEADCQVCITCQGIFDSETETKNHIKNSHKSDSGWINCLKCNFCSDLFKEKKTIYKHMLKDHYQLFTYLCKSCGQLFHSLLALKHHRSDHKHSLDGALIPKEESKYVIKFQLPTHVTKTNTFSQEMDEIFDCVLSKKK